MKPGDTYTIEGVYSRGRTMKWTVLGIIFAALSIICNVMLDDYVPGFAFLIMCFIAHATSEIIRAINQTHL